MTLTWTREKARSTGHVAKAGESPGSVFLSQNQSQAVGHWTFPGTAKKKPASCLASALDPLPWSRPSSHCLPASALLWSSLYPCLPLGCFQEARSRADGMTGRTSVSLPVRGPASPPSLFLSASERADARLLSRRALPVGSGGSVAFCKSLRLRCNSWEIESLLISNAWCGPGSEDGVPTVSSPCLFIQ